MTIRTLLFTPAGALRAPWRLLVFFGAVAVCAVPVLFLRTLLPPAFDRTPLKEAADSAALCLALLAGSWYALRRVDRRPWQDAWMGRDAARGGKLALGILLGTLAVGIPTLAITGIGWMRFAAQPDGPWWGAAIAALVLLAPAALFEELLARGYAMAVLRDGVGAVRAVALTSLVFGVLHAWNPGANAASIAMVTLAGVFLAAVVLSLRSLWAATLAHLAWNWTMAALFHAPVSGLPVATPDYRLLDTGPDWMTGGPWGPEAGAGAAVGMLTGTAYLYARWKRRREETRDTWPTASR